MEMFVGFVFGLALTVGAIALDVYLSGIPVCWIASA